MLYTTRSEWLDAPKKSIAFFGMSGLGKTHLANLLRETGDWFHYSVDYRIGTRYMGEPITDNAKREAMKVPFLAELLKSDSIYIASNITFHNLAPLSSYLGKPGDPAKGGLPMAEYARRQKLHRAAEVAAMLDTGHFVQRADDLYGYQNFVCDSSGSICEIVDPENPDDPVLTHLAAHTLPIWLEGTEAHTEELIRRFDRAPKPMCYQADFLVDRWAEYLGETGQAEDKVDPDAFVRWTYAKALAHRQPRYAAMAKWGITIKAADATRVTSAADLIALVAEHLPA